jgi:MFS transporter, DHA1 family, inner membrane transport protein
MAFFRNDAVNRVNVHYGIQALAQGAGAVFFVVFLLRAGVSISATLIALAAIMAGRFAIRPVILPLAKRWGIKPMVIIGNLGLALHYPILGEVQGVDGWLLALVIVSAVAEVFYWPCYNAYFSAIGDTEHRGHQISAREALVSIIGIIAPLLGAWMLLTLGPRPMFAIVGLVQALAALPLIGAPNVAVKASAPGAFRSARIGTILMATDGWFDAWYIFVWQIVLFLSLGESISAYGGAMALAALVGAACGLLLGRHIDAGYGRRAVLIAYSIAAAFVILRTISVGSPWLAVTANAVGALLWPLLLPTLGTASYNLAKASPCPMRFYIVAEGGWDIGCFSACLTAAAFAIAGIPLPLGMLLSLPALAVAAYVLRSYYGNGGVAPAAELRGTG